MRAFLRRNAKMHLKLGRRRKKKLKWHRPKGRDNKMREKRKGRPKTVSIGYKNSLDDEMKKTAFVKNLNDFEKTAKNGAIFLGHMGKKKRVEIAKKAAEMGITIRNLNSKKFLKRLNPKSGVKK